MYDDTGSTDGCEGLDGKSFDELYRFYKDLYKEVTEDGIDDFESEYRGSDEEQRDLLQYYQRFNGHMTKVPFLPAGKFEKA